MQRRAFTLIELLVVIGIITVLIAIVVPVLGVSRQSARATRCRSNLRQIEISLINYDSRNGSFPYSFVLAGQETPPGGYTGNFIYDSAGWRWFNYIFDYSRSELETNRLFWCPSRKIEGNIYKYNMLLANYGVNESVCRNRNSFSKNEFSGSPLSGTDIRSPGGTLLITDSGYAAINWYHVTDSPPVLLGKRIEDRSYIPGLSINKERKLLPEQEDDALNGRHLRKSVNIGFADGHAARQKADDLAVKKTLEGYKNLSPLWIPQKK